MDQDLIRVGQRIRLLRMCRGLTLEELAEKSGLYPGYIGDIERGCGRNPSLKSLAKIALALDVELYELFEPECDSDTDKQLALSKLNAICCTQSTKDIEFIAELVTSLISWKNG
ncbi:MAG: helix-turn-helix domain-containing protein [Limnochordia bacterium]|jgi:transcriptional regulator with XRE-family HTH domain